MPSLIYNPEVYFSFSVEILRRGVVILSGRGLINETCFLAERLTRTLYLACFALPRVVFTFLPTRSYRFSSRRNATLVANVEMEVSSELPSNGTGAAATINIPAVSRFASNSRSVERWHYCFRPRRWHCRKIPEDMLQCLGVDSRATSSVCRPISLEERRVTGLELCDQCGH
jgi:hypothetical protein